MNQKQSTLDLVKSNKGYFIVFLLFVVVGAIVLLTTKKGDTLLYINSLHTPFWDMFFKNATHLGDGIIFGIMLIPLGIVRIKYIFYGLATLATSGLGAQLFKRIFDEPRPLKYLGEAAIMNFVEGVRVHSHNSFPSGHTSTGFAICLLLAILVPNKKLGVLFGIVAIMIGMSRVYLVQHFFVDVYFGSILGVIMTILTYQLFQSWNALNTAGWTTYSPLEKIRG